MAHGFTAETLGGLVLAGLAKLRTDQHFESFIWRAEHTEVIGGDSCCPNVRSRLHLSEPLREGRITVGCAGDVCERNSGLGPSQLNRLLQRAPGLG